MRKKLLLASAAMAVAIGCTAAVAQEGSMEGIGAGASQSQGTAQHQPNPGGTSGAGGAMSRSQATPGGAARNQAVPEQQGMGPPKGTSQNEERGRSTRQRGVEENGKVMQRGAQKNKMQRGAEENNTTNMQRGAQKNEMQRGAEENNRTNMQRGAEENEQGGATRENRENNAQIQERGGSSGSTAVQNKSASAKSVQLSEGQRTRIKNIIIKDRNVARVNNANFRVAVGTAVPHDVHVAVLPPDVVRVVPQYKGFEYIVVRDQLLIIDPDTMKIVAILPA
jgi:hypothetical protein